jgi:hypothetical protein
MTSLVLGAVGAVVGGIFGGAIGAQIGWLAGSMIGNLIDPPKVQGPRLGDLKLQTATYGKFIPLFWGAGRLGGNIIDQTDLVEHKEKSGGKGGPEVTNYTYSSSFAIMIGAARRFGEDAIIGINRIWADGRLIWSLTDSTPIPCTVYTGSETQLPDPTFEAIHGVGEVPAYRGYAYVVFADYYLTDFGNRIPSFEFEVFTQSGDIPWRVATFSPRPVGGATSRTATLTDGVITYSSWDGTTPIYYHQRQWDIYGNEIGTELTSPTSVTGSTYNFAINLNSEAITIGGTDQFWYTADKTTGVIGQGFDISAANDYDGTLLRGNPSVRCGDFIYCIASITGGFGNTRIGQYSCASGIPGGFTGLTYALDAYYGTSVALGGSNTGHVYVLIGGINSAKLWKLDDAMNLVHFWDIADTTGTKLATSSYGTNTFWVYNNHICVTYYAGGTTWYNALIDIDPTTNVLTDGPTPLLSPHSGVINLSGGLFLDDGGTYSLDPPTTGVPLSTIVGDLSDMTPIYGDYDVSELTDTVRWFVIGSQMTVRNALQTLRQVFFFDAVESDDLVRFRKRSMTSTFSVPDGDLCARSYGEQSGEPLRTIRKKEQDLPRTVTMNYIDVDTDYQTGTQSSPRQTTLSQQDVTVDVPVGLTADEALQKCWTLQTAEWIERESFEWSTTRKWAKLEPCDVGLVRGRVIRIMTRTESPNGVIKWTGVLAAPSIYTNTAANIYIQPATAPPPDGWVPPTPPGAKADTTLIMLDLPLITDTDSPNGHYAAIYPASTATWSGAAIYKSVDGGSTYSVVGDSSAADVVGAVIVALGNFTGGNIFDEINSATVVVTSPGGTLVSASETAVLNGVNACAIGSTTAGWEVLQFKSASLIAANTYKLTGLLRGRRGTEWAIATHGANETFVLLPSTMNISAPSGEINSLRKYKPVTFGKALADATAQNFTNTGVALKPYSPTGIGGGRNAANDITINWIRRTRSGGTWAAGGDVPLSENAEFYRVFVYSSNTYATLKREIYVTTNTATYLASEQTTDFGSAQSTIYIEVVQGGTYGNGYAARGTV